MSFFSSKIYIYFEQNFKKISVLPTKLKKIHKKRKKFFVSIYMGEKNLFNASWNVKIQNTHSSIYPIKNISSFSELFIFLLYFFCKFLKNLKIEQTLYKVKQPWYWDRLYFQFLNYYKVNFEYFLFLHESRLEMLHRLSWIFKMGRDGRLWSKNR